MSVISEESKTGITGALIVSALNRLIFLVIRRYTGSNQSKRRGQSIIHVHLHIQIFLLQKVTDGVKTRGT